MLFNSLDYPEYRAFKRLVLMVLSKYRRLTSQLQKRLIFLGSEHGICKEDALEIMEFCLDDYQLTRVPAVAV